MNRAQDSSRGMVFRQFSIYCVAVPRFKSPDKKSLVVRSLSILSLCQYFLFAVDDSSIFIVYKGMGRKCSDSCRAF